MVDSQEAITVPVRRRLSWSNEVSRTVVTAAPSMLADVLEYAPIYPFDANRFALKTRIAGNLWICPSLGAVY
ncbi:hypothetical protein GCM10022248_40270 [Nonomuraea soli]